MKLLHFHHMPALFHLQWLLFHVCGALLDSVCYWCQCPAMSLALHGQTHSPSEDGECVCGSLRTVVVCKNGCKNETQVGVSWCDVVCWRSLMVLSLCCRLCWNCATKCWLSQSCCCVHCNCLSLISIACWLVAIVRCFLESVDPLSQWFAVFLEDVCSWPPPFSVAVYYVPGVH